MKTGSLSACSLYKYTNSGSEFLFLFNININLDHEYKRGITISYYNHTVQCLFDKYMRETYEILIIFLPANLIQTNLVALCHFSTQSCRIKCHVLRHLTNVLIPSWRKKNIGSIHSHLCTTSCTSS
jgi:hypothetical protein